MFLRRRSDQVELLLSDWEQAVSAGDKVNQYAFNDKLKVN